MTMNIDFYYGTMYVLGQLTGLEPASTITAAHYQYVDDATTNGLLYFKGDELFERFSRRRPVIHW